MSEGKRRSFLRSFSNDVQDYIGVREGEDVRPRTNLSLNSPPRRDFTVDRSIGEINPALVFPDPNQPRKEFDDQSLRQLADDIRDRGQLQPIGVRWDDEQTRWLIMYGERRWRAITLAELPKIKCKFYTEAIPEAEIRSIQLVENLQRENLKPVEEAQAFKDLIDLNDWTGKQVAEYLHVSAANVSRALKLLKLPEEMKARIDDGTIPPSTAYHVAKEKNAKKRETLIAKALKGDLDEQSARTITTKVNHAGPRIRRSTNETFKVTQGIRVVVSGRKHVGEQGVLDALLEAVENQRMKLHEQKKAA